MGILDLILNNKTLAVANRIAPVLSASILTAYVLSGKRVGVVFGNEITEDQKNALEARMEALERKVWWEFGSGA